MFGFGADIFLALPALIIALSFHEFAHAYVSNRLGDPTPRLQGRLTLNPLAHLDPIGFLMLLVFKFGWAKPVLVNPINYKNREKGYALVSLAGPVMNLLLGLVSVLLYYVVYLFFYFEPLLSLLNWLITYNVYLAIFNLLPIPPLDGSKLLFFFLPRSVVYRYLDTVSQYGTIILVFLLISGVVSSVVGPLADVIMQFFFRIAGILFSVF